MKILITNDDGIEAGGIRVLTEWATSLGDVTVVAPRFEQSAKSHAIELRRPFEVKRVEYLPGVTAYAVDSTPADCVRFATCTLPEKFDLVLSGINSGYNIGEDIVYSATCGAIFEAANQSIPAVAVSSDTGTHEGAARQLDAVLAFFRENDLLARHHLYNVNVPPTPARGIRITRQGGAYFRDRYRKIGEDLYLAEGYCAYSDQNDETLDTDTVMSGYISVSPLTEDRTDRDVYRRLVGSDR